MPKQLDEYCAKPNGKIFLAALGLCAAYFLFLHLKVFQAGYFDEDFAWLSWSRQVSWWTFLKTNQDSYFRPLAVNLPFFLFSGTSAGLIAWKLLALLLTFLSCVLACAGGREKSGLLPLFGLGLMLLSGPFLHFGIYYRNAFDYVLFPFLAVAYVQCLRAQRPLAAQIVFLLSIFSKEQAILLPVFALLHFPQGRRARIIFAVGTLTTAVIFLLAHGALVPSEGRVAGFALDFSPRAIMRALVDLFHLNALGGSHGGWGSFWAACIWAALGWLAAELLAAREMRALARAALAVMLALAFFAPLALAANLTPHHHGGGFFFLLAQAFVVAVPALKHAAARRLALVMSLLALASVGAALMHTKASAEAYVQRGLAYQKILVASDPMLSRCTKWNRVVTSGLPELLGSNGHAEYAIWALRWRHPGVRFYALTPPGFDVNNVIPVHRPFWVNAHQASGHPSLQLERDAAGEVQAKGNTRETCGTPENSR